MQASEILKTYRKELIAEIEAVQEGDFEGCIRLLLDAYRQDKQIFLAGNGGSAATANHFLCDFGKNAVRGNRRRFRVISVCDNIERITSLGNDIAYEAVFSEQLVNLMNAGDLLIVISASGSSPNILRACEYARERGARVMALAGFSGGKLKDLADAALFSAMTSYERLEDLHLMLLHLFVCYFKANQVLLDGAGAV